MDNEDIVKQGARDFCDEFENGATSTHEQRAEDAWMIYMVMKEE